MCMAMFRAKANEVEDFQYNAWHKDRKPHKSNNHPMWHRWKGGYRVRGHLSPMTCYQKTSYQKRLKSFKRMETYKMDRRKSYYVLYNRHFDFRGYY